MSFFDWDPSYSVRVDQFDNHHKELIHLMNEAHENFMSQACQEATRVVIDRLVAYAQYHFSAEEKWMKSTGYEDLPQHTAEHDKFWRTIFDFQTAFHYGEKKLSFEVLSFLKEWLTEHILTSDADYGSMVPR